jgi:hypothetical protein
MTTGSPPVMWYTRQSTPVGEDDPFHALVDRRHLHLAQMVGVQLGRHPLVFDEGYQLLVDANPVVGELTLDQILRSQVSILVLAERFTPDVGHE